MTKRVIIFLILNFSALYIGSFATKTAVVSNWYVNLNKAPWSPPGYVFGIAWSFIMICFAFYMAYLIPKVTSKKVIALFGLQWILNVGWNPIFFYYHQTTLGLVIITFLTFLVSWLLYKYANILKFKTILIAPYFIWLLIATSLNAYVVFMN